MGSLTQLKRRLRKPYRRFGQHEDPNGVKWSARMHVEHAVCALIVVMSAGGIGSQPNPRDSASLGIYP